MANPITRLSVAQQALALAGRQISIGGLSTTGSSREEAMAAVHFDQTLDLLLQRHEWRWATRVVAPSLAAFPFNTQWPSDVYPANYDAPDTPPHTKSAIRLYARPRTWLRVWAVYTTHGRRLIPFDEFTDAAEQRFLAVRQRDLPPLYNAELETRYPEPGVRAVVTDSQSPSVNEPAYWSPAFRDAFLYELATRIARSMNTDETMVASLDAKAKECYGVAVAANDREGSSEVGRLVAEGARLDPERMVVKQALAAMGVPAYTATAGVEGAYHQCYDLLPAAWARVQSAARPASHQRVVTMLPATGVTNVPGSTDVSQWMLPEGMTDLVLSLWWEERLNGRITQGNFAEYRQTGAIYRVDGYPTNADLKARVLVGAPTVPADATSEGIEACAYSLASLAIGSIVPDLKRQQMVEAMYQQRLADYIRTHANLEGEYTDARPRGPSWLEARRLPI